MNVRMNKSVRNWLILGTLIVVAILATVLALSTLWLQPPPPFEFRRRPAENIFVDIELFYTIQTVVSTINVTLSVFLLFIYIDIYRKTQSEFTIGLIILSAVLLLHAVVSNPFVTRIFGFRAFGLGPFILLPDLFTLAALSVLLYLSARY
jgi:hypothetical protein